MGIPKRQFVMIRGGRCRRISAFGVTTPKRELSVFASNLRGLRGSKGLKQLELANEVGVSQSLISNWENDHSTPDVDELTQLCDYFKVDPAALVGHRDLVLPRGPRPSKRRHKRPPPDAQAGAS